MPSPCSHRSHRSQQTPRLHQRSLPNSPERFDHEFLFFSLLLQFTSCGGDLGCSQDLARTDTEGREPEDAIAISLHESLYEPAGLRKCACTQVGFHWDLKQAIRYPLSLRFCFTQADTSKFGVGKQTIWDLPTRGHTVAAG